MEWFGKSFPDEMGRRRDLRGLMKPNSSKGSIHRDRRGGPWDWG